MHRRLLWFRVPASVGLLAGCWLMAAADAWAQPLPPPAATLGPPVLTQETAPTQPAVPPAADLPAPPPGTVLEAPADGQPSADGSGAAGGQASADGSCPSKGFDFKKVPPVRILPRVGNFPVPPTGAGYYSLMDVVTNTYRSDRPKFPYSPVSLMFNSFFEADFRYLDDPNNTQHDIFDALHRIRLGDNWLFSTGGEIRWRDMHEVNSRLLGVTNQYDLLRVRTYGDLWYKDMFRVYVEFISANSYNENLPPAAIDVERNDLLNAFVDLKLFELDGYNAYIRGGRQELLLGSQRLVSPLDWANTRRTFQGVHAFRQGEKFDVDIFWVQPVIPATNTISSVDRNQNFAGIWTTYRPQKGQFLDMYYLMLDNSNHVAQLGLTRYPGTFHTFGGRYAGNYKNLVFDTEQDVQIGDRGGQEILSASTSNGIGWNFKKMPWNPTWWFYYDYASGTNSSSGDYHTFNQLFPFGHWYLGYLDLVGRQNIQDIQTQFFLYPTKWITFNAQYHHFNLAAAQDALYNAAGVAIRRDPTGKAGTDVGDEIDLVANFHLDAHSDILIGWSKLYSGEFIRNTAPTAAAAFSPELFYVQYSFRW